MKLSEPLADLSRAEVAKAVKKRVHQPLVTRIAELAEPAPYLVDREKATLICAPSLDHRLQLARLRTECFEVALSLDQDIVVAHRNDDFVSALVAKPA